MTDFSYKGDKPPDQLNLAQYCLTNGTISTPEKPALIVCSSHNEAEIWSYRKIQDAVLRMAAGLGAHGLERGDRIFLRMENSVEYALMFLAANAAGLVPIPASSQLTAEEAGFMIEDSGSAAVAWSERLALPELSADVLILNDEAFETLKNNDPQDYAATSAEDPAYLIYTSGTSGKPKGVLHAQRAAWGRRPMYQGWYGIGADDVMLHTGAFNWTYTLGTGLTDPWTNGATAVVYTGPREIEIWSKLATRHGATIIASVPTLYRQILKYDPPTQTSFPELRHGLTAGEPMPVEVAREWTAKTGTELYEALGMSEISTYISSSPTIPARAGSPGKAQEGRSVAILAQDGSGPPLPAGQTGLLAIHRSDPGLMLGYWQRPDEEAEVMYGEWFAGGDLARMDNDGYIWFEGRNDDLMNAMGFRVSPLEVEKVLAGHPSVGEAAVAERQVRANVSVIAAYVVPADGHNVDPEALIAFSSEHLAAYKTPRAVIEVESLPRTANGKLMRRALQSLSQTGSKV